MSLELVGAVKVEFGILFVPGSGVRYSEVAQAGVTRELTESMHRLPIYLHAHAELLHGVGGIVLAGLYLCKR